MGIALITSTGDMIDLSATGWGEVLYIATENGWEPMGTIPHEWCASPENWNGNYYSSDLQTVCAEDTLKIATALELAVAEFERIPTEWIKEVFDIEWIKEFIDVCRASGGIMIS